MRTKRFSIRNKQSDAPATPPAGDGQQEPQTPPSGDPPATPQQPSNVQVPPGYVPADNLRAVAEERDALKRERDEAERKKAEDEGRWQELAGTEKQKREAAEQRFIAVARRAAFVSQASKEGVTDPEAAYKLAVADGLLNDVKVDDDGNADVKAIAEAVKSAQGTYKFLKRDGSFGGERGGQPEPDASDPNLSSRERMRRAFSTSGR